MLFKEYDMHTRRRKKLFGKKEKPREVERNRVRRAFYYADV